MGFISSKGLTFQSVNGSSFFNLTLTFIISYQYGQ